MASVIVIYILGLNPNTRQFRVNCRWSEIYVVLSFQTSPPPPHTHPPKKKKKKKKKKREIFLKGVISREVVIVVVVTEIARERDVAPW